MSSAESTSGIESLLELIPPTNAVDARSSDEWAGVIAATGPLPPDYTAFIDRYGFVRLDDFLMIYSPFAPPGPGNLIDQMAIDLDAYRTLRLGHEDEMPLPPLPEPGGLLPLGRSDNGDVLFWLTGGDDPWPIIVIGEGDRRHTRLDLTLVELLRRLVTSEVVLDVFPSSFPRGPSQFVPAI